MLDKIFSKYACVKEWEGTSESRLEALESNQYIPGTKMAVITREPYLRDEYGRDILPVRTFSASILEEIISNGYSTDDFNKLSSCIEKAFSDLTVDMREAFAETEVVLVEYFPDVWTDHHDFLRLPHHKPE